MYTLSEIKDIRRKYVLKENGDIETTGKEETKSPSEMTTEEKSYIESALFLYRHVKMSKDEFKDLSDEDFLKKMQVDFTKEALSRNEYTATTMDIAKTPSQVIWRSILSENNGALTYFNRMLAENGKKLQNFEKKGGIKSFTTSISYDLVDDNKGKFLQSLNPSNPIYTQTLKAKEITPEQIQRRRVFVDKLMQIYKQCETDENYQDRANREEKDMTFVARTVNSNTTIERIPEPATARIMDLLYAAQNISLSGERDYLNDIIKQPIISETLLKMRNGNALDKMSKKAQERRNNGTISEHKPTHGEITIREANTLISEHPNAVEVAKRKLDGRSSFQIDKGDTENLRRARLIEVVARTQGKSITRTTDLQGNKILQVDDDKEVSK